MEDDRPPAEQPLGAWPPPSTPATPPPSAGPVVSWGPPSGTAAPVQWNVIEKPRVPPPPGTVYAGVGIRFVALILDLLPVIALGIILMGPVFGDMYRALIDVLPLALSIAGLGLLALLAAPVIGLTYVEAYVAARDEAAGGRVA